MDRITTADFDLCAIGHIHRAQKLDGCRAAYYSGAVAQLNFNDEGQERGYYIHDIDRDTKEVKSEFKPLWTREFKTFRLEDADIARFNAEGTIENIEDAKDRIVRVLYNCTDEHNKALNKTAMEEELKNAGAFFVQEITPMKIQITVNKNALKEDDTPEDNLRTYLAERGTDETDAGRIMDTAAGIIQEAAQNSTAARAAGMFVPVEIEVKNYRNYREEKFNFEDVKFCTINGENGAGKSSLFMDAMCDCLFEETREGDITGWICNAEDARSGSIKFTFRMGEATYRVTRTRTKSGKATLNIAELIDGEWEDRSRERMRDTQQEIINTIGMDSLTLRATALIMQDRYGVFLTADKDARMAILGNILGLGIYDDMYKIAARRATEVNREIRAVHDKAATLVEGVKEVAEIEDEMRGLHETLANIEAGRAENSKTMAEAAAELKDVQDAVQQAIELNTRIMQTAQKEQAAQAQKTAQSLIIFNAVSLLGRREEIEARVAEYKEATEREKELLTDKAKAEETARRKDAAQTARDKAAAEYDGLKAKREAAAGRLEPARKQLEREGEITRLHGEYIKCKAELEEQREAKAEFDRATEKLFAADRAAADAQQKRDAGLKERDAKITQIMHRAELLKKSNCKYAEEVQCVFLKDAIDAKAELEKAQQERKEYAERAQVAVREAQVALNQARDSFPTSYKAEREKALKSALDALETSEAEYAGLAVAKANAEAAEREIEELNERIKDVYAEIIAKDDEIKKLEAELDEQRGSVEEYGRIKARIYELEKFVEDEKKLPVAEEQERTARARIEEQDTLIDEYRQTREYLEAERAKVVKRTEGREGLQTKYDFAVQMAKEYDESVQVLNRKIGELEKEREVTEAKRKEARELEKRAEEYATEAADLETLKEAFSEDGIAHNIVRGIIPILEATATNILGAMSGGKMSVEFVTEKVLKSNSKKEVTTLDVVINDSATGRLPYMSRSGGEKVKSALAVILALSEIKSTKAGVRVGFLGIDEPPYLDADGTQAYCDALEAIQSRYPDITVMAITHDESFKARFPQSVTVYKDAEGSHVRYDD